MRIVIAYFIVCIINLLSADVIKIKYGLHKKRLQLYTVKITLFFQLSLTYLKLRKLSARFVQYACV